MSDFLDGTAQVHRILYSFEVTGMCIVKSCQHVALKNTVRVVEAIVAIQNIGSRRPTAFSHNACFGVKRQPYDPNFLDSTSNTCSTLTNGQKKSNRRRSSDPTNLMYFIYGAERVTIGCDARAEDSDDGRRRLPSKTIRHI